jgi:hypothetical protein
MGRVGKSSSASKSKHSFGSRGGGGIHEEGYHHAAIHSIEGGEYEKIALDKAIA